MKRKTILSLVKMVEGDFLAVGNRVYTRDNVK